MKMLVCCKTPKRRRDENGLETTMITVENGMSVVFKVVME